MVQLPGRISIRPLAQYTNKPQTHSVSIKDNKLQVDQKFAYQSLRNQVDYKDVTDIRVSMDDRSFDPLTRNVTISTSKRQIYEIPEMDARQAVKLKEAIESQKNNAKIQSENVAKNKDSSKVMSFSRFRR